MSKSNLKLSVVIPCFNESQSIRELHKRVSEICNTVVSQDYELILVNDGSKDNSKEVVERYILANPSFNIKLIDKPNNKSLEEFKCILCSQHLLCPHILALL